MKKCNNCEVWPDKAFWNREGLRVCQMCGNKYISDNDLSKPLCEYDIPIGNLRDEHENYDKVLKVNPAKKIVWTEFTDKDVARMNRACL